MLVNSSIHLQARPRRIIVAVPAKDEADRISDALVAVDVAAGGTSSPVGVLVLANDCEDDTIGVTRKVGRHFRHAKLEIAALRLPGELAHAGGARRCAVAFGIDRFEATANDIIISTDADARMRPDALWRIDAAISHGDDLVLAKLHCVTDPLDPVSDEALRWDQLGAGWRHCVRQFVDTVLRGRIAPPELHDDYGGAGIAVRVDAYHRLGGFRAITCNEDYEFVRSADKADMRVNRHSGAIVDVLARVQGRATGGMAEALRHSAAAAAQRVPRLVEHHAVTVRRILRNPSHACAFATEVEVWEGAEAAIAGLQQAIASFGHHT